jgi:hypothetical protein
LDLLTNLFIAFGCLVLAQSSPPPGRHDPRAEEAPARDGSSGSASKGPAAGAAKEEGQRVFERRSPWFIILNSPQDLDELWRKIERPDLVLIKGDRLDKPADGTAAAAASPRFVVESVKIAGRVAGENADLSVELSVAVKGGDAVWVPIRLDNQRLVAARESTRDLDLRQHERGEWQVRILGEGEHRIRVDVRAAVSTELARKRLSVAIPEAASTRLELDFAGRESDVVVGANEDFGQTALGPGKGTRLMAQLSPRSKLEVAWLDNAESGAQPPPLLTVQGEIAIEIDAQQLRTRSSWSIRCVRGSARSLELSVDDHESVTELELDDQAMDDEIDQTRGPGKLTIPLADPLRAGATARLVFRTRRPLPRSGARRISFVGFSFAGAREQSGYIGITKSPNLWVGPVAPRGLHRIDPSKLPSDLRARPATSLAYEFLDQPFLLDLGVESSPPQVRGETRTFLEVDSDKVRSQMTIDLTWLGELFELELGVAPGLEVISVGPAESVESTHLADAAAGADRGSLEKHSRRLSIRLTPQARDRNKVTLKLAAIEPIEARGSIKLGLFSLEETAAVTASYSLSAGRGLALELDDDTGRLRSSPETRSRFQSLPGSWPGMLLPREETSRQLFLADLGSSRSLPIRITRHARLVRHETALAAKVSPRSVEVLERTTISVRHGDLRSVQIRVPAEFAERWELLDRQIDTQELSREADGSRRYRLSFDRAVLDQTTLRFRYRLPLESDLDSATAREVTIKRVTIEEGALGPARVGLELDPEVVLEDSGPGWIRGSDEFRVEPSIERSVMHFVEQDPPTQGRPFTFRARALAQLALPSLVIPRLLIKTTQGVDGSRRTTARYWVELHGADFSFALPEGLEWIEARLDGRIADQVDYDQSRSRYRLRFPSEAIARPALVELEFQEAAPKAGASWRLPELQGGAVVLQALWEARLPWSLALVGIPRGWSDENHWSWTGFSWKRRPGRDSAGLNEWLVGAGVSGASIDDFAGSGSEGSDRYLFSRRGQPSGLGVWLVPGSWLVFFCSGLTLVIGFLAIFLKLRFRSIWLGLAGVAVLSATLVEPTVTFLVLQSAALGALLALLGLVIERSIERGSMRWSRSGRSAPPAVRPVTDSSLNRSAGVGSDDSTAIRVRVPSTVDHTPAVDAGQDVRPEVRSSTLGRA